MYMNRRIMIKFTLGDRLVFTFATKKKRCTIIIQNGQLKDVIPLYVRNKKHFEIKNVRYRHTKIMYPHGRYLGKVKSRYGVFSTT